MRDGIRACDMDGIKGGFRLIEACEAFDGNRKKGRKPRTSPPVWLTGSKRLKVHE